MRENQAMTRGPVRLLAVLLAIAGPVPALARQSLPAPSPSAVMAALSGKTIRLASDRLGPDIEYFAPNGSTWLWRPGRWDIAMGTWSDGTFQITRSPSPGAAPETSVVAMVCFQFAATSYGAAARATQGRQACFKLAELQAAAQEVVDGDVLDLQGGKAPCRMCRANMTLAEVQSRRAP